MATPVCPPWAPDAWALVAGMYWLYGCWKIHNHKHTLHCCTLRTPTLMLFLHGPPPKISIYCRDLFDFLRTCACVDGCGKTEASNRDVLSFLLPPHVSFYLFLPTKLQYCPLLRCTVNLSYEQLLSDRRGPFLISRSDTPLNQFLWYETYFEDHVYCSCHFTSVIHLSACLLNTSKYRRCVIESFVYDERKVIFFF